MHTLSALLTVDNAFHFGIDAGTLIIDAITLKVVRTTKLDDFATWIAYLVIGDVFSLLYRMCHIVAYVFFTYPQRNILFLIDTSSSLLDILAYICSLFIMLRQFKKIAEIFRQDQNAKVFQQAGAISDPGTWPPPPV